MKKYFPIIGLLFIIIAIIMTGCRETYLTTGLEFVQVVHTNDKGKDPEAQLVFKDPKGELHIYIATNQDLISLLETGSKYDVVAYQGDELSTANAVEKITKSK